MIMLALRGFLIIMACHIITVVMPAPAKVYDQRQTGDLNVQIELKDLHVVALLNSELLDDYTDYDYFYDYADFTIRPSNKPTTSSTEKNDIAETTENQNEQNLSLQNSTISTSPDNILNSTEQSTTLSNNEEAQNADQSNGTTISTSNANDKSQEGQSSEEDSGSEATTTTSSITMKPLRILRSQKRCKSGYIPNGDGRCRRASRPWLSLLP